MIGKEAHLVNSVSTFSKPSLVDETAPVYSDVKAPASVVDPIQQLHANVQTLKDLTSQLSFMVREINTLVKK